MVRASTSSPGGSQGPLTTTTTRPTLTRSNIDTDPDADGDADRGVHVVYQYFQVQVTQKFELSKVKARQAEYNECLLQNLSHQHVQQVHVLLETCSDKISLESALSSFDVDSSEKLKLKLKTVMLGRQMKYSDAFEYCNNNLQGQIAVVLNADIFVGSGLGALISCQKEVFEVPATVLSLTRHERHICDALGGLDLEQTEERRWCGCPFFRGRPNYFGSHDSFWFVPPLKQGVLTGCQHVQNRWGAEHKVINELLRHGYVVENPSITLQTFHNHISDIHPWRYGPGGRNVLADPRDHRPLPPTDIWRLIENRRKTRKLRAEAEKDAQL